ncbi:hypothetical protein ABPG77_011409 [Micractinium sp. CCAP 211/92]
MSAQEQGLAERDGQGGLPAVQHFLRYCCGMLKRGEKPPPLPEGLDDWPQTIVPGFLAGALHGGFSKWADIRQEGAAAGRGVASPASALPRAFRLLDAANRRGMALGGMAALFFLVEMLSGVYCGRRAFMQDAAVGGAAVGLVFAAHRVTSSPVWPPPNLAANTATILGIGLVQGFLQRQQHQERLREAAAAAEAEDERRRQELAAARKQDAASLLLAQLEAQLSAASAQQQQQQEQQQQQQQGQPGLQGLHAEEAPGQQGQSELQEHNPAQGEEEQWRPEQEQNPAAAASGWRRWLGR